MYDVADVAVDEVNAALDQFVSKAKSRTTIGYGAGEHIRAMMHKALGADRADNMLARITPPTRSNKLEMLQWMEAKEISRNVENEHPQIMALVLAHPDPPVAAEVLQLLPLDMQDHNRQEQGRVGQGSVSTSRALVTGVQTCALPIWANISAR